jgi:hypothetical protein
LKQLLGDYIAGDLETELFCSRFEHIYNMELDRDSLTPNEAAAFGPLFEEVVWYSPFPEERSSIPNYRSAEDIRKAAEIAARGLYGRSERT